jgi:hypothetical protein
MKKIINGFKPIYTAILLLTLGFSLFYMSGCSENSNNTTAPKTDQVSLPMDISNQQVASAIAVQNKYNDNLLAKPDVVGVGTGISDNGTPAIIVFTKTADEMVKEGNSTLALNIPASIENVPVVVNPIGTIHAFSLTGTYNPVPIGVSIISVAEGCAAGTLGCEVTDGTSKYILSCNHVLANENAGSIGDNIVQPGTYDNHCSYTNYNIVATLSAFCPIDFSGGNNTIDAAIAIFTIPNSGDNRTYTAATPSGYYGFPSSTTVSPAVNMGIQKVGRTTSLTTGKITAINATVTVQYSSTQYAKFVNQIVTSSRFCKAGDSGSLVITKNSSKNPVGLLFAGTSNGTTIVNPINYVLSYFNVTICSHN